MLKMSSELSKETTTVFNIILKTASIEVRGKSTAFPVSSVQHLIRISQEEEIH